MQNTKIQTQDDKSIELMLLKRMLKNAYVRHAECETETGKLHQENVISGLLREINLIKSPKMLNNRSLEVEL